MNEFTLAARQLVQDLLEMDDEIDVKDLDEPTPGGYWRQIGGDVNAWVWGGTFFNPVTRELLHFDGIDTEGGGVDPDDVEVPPQMLAKLPPEQEDWRENTERDRIIGNYQYAKAELLTNQKPRPFYVMSHIPMDQLPHQWRRYEHECPTGLDQETWEQMTIESKIDELAGYFGWAEYGHRIDMNYYQAHRFTKGAL